jgi:Transposase and inactivated derivatives
MLRIDFTPEDVERLDYERYHHPHPRVQRKMEVVYLKSQGVPHRDIKRIERICENTLLSYLRDYQEGGIERLKAIRLRRPESALSAHQCSLEAYFREHPPASVQEAATKLEELTGIKRSPTRVRVFMKKLGLARHKVGALPAKAEELEPRLEQARAGNRAIFL